MAIFQSIVDRQCKKMTVVSINVVFTPLLVTIAISLGRPQTKCKFNHPHPYAYRQLKFGEDRPSKFGDILADMPILPIVLKS